jgi:hypothetical protein
VLIGVAMKLTITLTDEESRFLQDLQSLLNGRKRFGQERCTLEDIIHECIKTVQYAGSEMPGDAEKEKGGAPDFFRRD